MNEQLSPQHSKLSTIIRTADRVVPMIYCYSTPEIERHNGWVKIGYSEQDVNDRIAQQTHTADILIKKEWQGNAIFEDGSGESFRDTMFHAYLRKLNVENKPKTEWFKISGKDSKAHFNDFRENRGILSDLGISPYTLRNEQEIAVQQTVDYARNNENGEFLWNAKPRFGKTLSVYDFCKQLGAKKVLIVTNRPAIAHSWYDDYAQFFGTESGYSFVSEVRALQDKPLCLTRQDYLNKGGNIIEFVSLQDLKGSIYFGGKFDKLREVSELEWDVLVIDEAHEGVDTYKTDVAFDHIKRRFTLHLSGTPFKALANDKFRSNAIFNWTYADEQRMKRNWEGEDENPYATLPQLNMLTYKMSDIVRDELQKGIEIDGEMEEYAFDLNEFFRTNSQGVFVHESSVDRFLDALTTQTKFPFSTEELRNELSHTLWLLHYVDSAKALAVKLRNHAIFKDYEIVLAAGDGSLEDENENTRANALQNVRKAIKPDNKTITLSVGQLTTGVTIPEWSAVLMLSNVKSPALYMQAAFRAQNPCLFRQGKDFYRKENAYVFDFDPARTLTIFEEFANDLSSNTSNGRGDSDTRKQNVRELLNFFPVIGEDESGEMVELNAEQVLSIPRKIHAQEVVRRGFMCDFLFQNITNIFRAPQAVIDILHQFTPVAEPRNTQINVHANTAEELQLDEQGNVSIPKEQVIGTAADIFGEKIYDVKEQLADVIDHLQQSTEPVRDTKIEQLKRAFKTQAVQPILQEAKENYGNELSASQKKRLEKRLTDEANRIIEKTVGNYRIEEVKLNEEKSAELNSCTNNKERKAVNQKFEQKLSEEKEKLKVALQQSVNTFIEKVGEETVRTVETAQKENEKKSIEDRIKDHLRGFSRTIPSFLMAYGSDEVTLENFDTIIPDKVFLEVTSISLEQFRFLRDGGDYTNNETQEIEHFEGHLFDSVVFNDSVKEFMNKRAALANYFEESQTEDIFDYIPPQKTNQIFTPKHVVKQMVDMLEQENPGCFDDPNKTFADLYMKSGLYIAEIVKRLYRSSEMRKSFPDAKERLLHIFDKQVFGVAPTEIIYKIATNFILGFDEDFRRKTFNFRMADTLSFAKEGTMEEKLGEIFG